MSLSLVNHLNVGERFYSYPSQRDGETAIRFLKVYWWTWQLDVSEQRGFERSQWLRLERYELSWRVE